MTKADVHPYATLSYTLHVREPDGEETHLEHIYTAHELHTRAQEHIAKGRIVLGYSINGCNSPISGRVIPPTGIRKLLHIETE